MRLRSIAVAGNRKWNRHNLSQLDVKIYIKLSWISKDKESHIFFLTKMGIRKLLGGLDSRTNGNRMFYSIYTIL